MQQRIGFCSTADGVRIAYATAGTGPPLVVASAGISHLELDWEEPRVRDFWETIGQHHTVVRYDRHGCGLSDRNRSDFSLDSEIRPIDAVVASSSLPRIRINSPFSRLGLDPTAHAAFVSGTGEIFSQTSHWEFVQSNIQ
jgi:pimeloyl-ACP methyl ester carboxylesterase